MNRVSRTKIGYLECKMCKSYSLEILIPINKKTMDKFDEHVQVCSSNPAKFSKNDNVVLGYN